jgi:hypothetical protein
MMNENWEFMNILADENPQPPSPTIAILNGLTDGPPSAPSQILADQDKNNENADAILDDQSVDNDSVMASDSTPSILVSSDKFDDSDSDFDADDVSEVRLYYCNCYCYCVHYNQYIVLTVGLSNKS